MITQIWCALCCVPLYHFLDGTRHRDGSQITIRRNTLDTLPRVSSSLQLAYRRVQREREREGESEREKAINVRL